MSVKMVWAPRRNNRKVTRKKMPRVIIKRPK